MWVNDQDLAPQDILDCLSQPAVRLLRNVAVCLLRRDWRWIHLSDVAAATLAGCKLHEISDVRTELIAHELIDYRQTNRLPRYTLLNPAGLRG
ncbi:hypothetical protein GCM10022270_23520 [Terriglobus aquaticus]